MMRSNGTTSTYANLRRSLPEDLKIDMDAAVAAQKALEASKGNNPRELDGKLPKLARRIQSVDASTQNDPSSTNFNGRGQTSSPERRLGNRRISLSNVDIEELQSNELQVAPGSVALKALDTASKSPRRRLSLSMSTKSFYVGDSNGTDTTTSVPSDTETGSVNYTASFAMRSAQVPPSSSLSSSLVAPKKKIDGREVQQGHTQYALTYGMMLGIRVTASMIPESTSPGVDMPSTEDFEVKVSLVFPPEGSKGSVSVGKEAPTISSAADTALQDGASYNYSTPPHKLKNSFKFRDYMPKAFRAVRQLSGIDEAEYITSVAGDFNYIEFVANSKSGQFFFYSYDGKFMIKTLTKEESKLLRDIFPGYLSHLYSNTSSLLVRFVGMHRVKMKFLGEEIYFVIMTSVFDTEKLIHTRYDLKGSTIGRYTEVKEGKQHEAVLKDLNLIQAGRVFRLGKNIDVFESTLRADTDFLASINVMDYSLLIGIHEETSKKAGRRLSSARMDMGPPSPSSFGSEQWQPSSPASEGSASDSEFGSVFQAYCGGIRREGGGEIYFMGIIDILQLYNTGKQLETIFKGMVSDRSQLSSIEPVAYGKRFVDFILGFTDYDSSTDPKSTNESKDSAGDKYP